MANANCNVIHLKWGEYINSFGRTLNENIHGIYHYTSIQNLYSILNSRELWMNPVQNHTDRMEIQSGIELFKKELVKLKGKICQENISNTVKIINNDIFYATVSFCKENSNPNMWYCYANDFKGAVIEFDYARFDKKLSKLDQGNGTEKPKGQHIRSYVSYNAELYSEFMGNYTAMYLEHHVNCVEKGCYLVWLTYALALLPLVKNTYFSHEKEYRICFVQITKEHKLAIDRSKIVFPNNDPSKYQVRLELDFDDIKNIFLANKECSKLKNVIKNIKKLTGVDYGKKIHNISICENELKKFRAPYLDFK